MKWDDKKGRKNQERLQKIAQEAAEQSHRTHIPEIQSQFHLSSSVKCSKL